MDVVETRAATREPTWSGTWRFVVGLVVAALFAWIAFIRVERIPLLGFADLGFHELGHLIMYMFPISEILTAAMGSILQVAIPAGMAVYFWFWRKDRFATALMLCWTASSMRDVAVYVADAPVRALPLLGGDNVTHDWWFILRRLDAMEHAGALAGFITFVGIVALIVAAGLCVWGLIGTYGLADRLRPTRRVDVSGLPVRRARPPRG